MAFIVCAVVRPRQSVSSATSTAPMQVRPTVASATYTRWQTALIVSALMATSTLTSLTTSSTALTVTPAALRAKSPMLQTVSHADPML
jgi:hypothetical protein